MNPITSSLRLPDFILGNTAAILAEWDAFAKSIWPASGPSLEDVRDHAEAILRAAARDMKSAQTGQEQSDKSKGLAEVPEHGDKLDTASAQHAVGRATSGFDLRAVIAEYRALRASVVRLWIKDSPSPDRNDLADLTRFHESMDQSLAEAVYRYSEHLDKSREMFLSILEHDLRNPLNAISILAESLAEVRPNDDETVDTATQILSSTEAVTRMLNDFLDFAVSRLGQTMPVTSAPADLAALCREVVAEVRTGCPGCSWHVETPDELHGEWDRARLRQLLSNLLNNAVQHGDPNGTITISLIRDESRVTLSVHNQGPAIPEELVPCIFDPLVRGPNPGTRPGSVGLGLYIAREVALAHRGHIGVASTQADGTTFTVTLPLTSRSTQR